MERTIYLGVFNANKFGPHWFEQLTHDPIEQTILNKGTSKQMYVIKHSPLWQQAMDETEMDWSLYTTNPDTAKRFNSDWLGQPWIVGEDNNEK